MEKCAIIIGINDTPNLPYLASPCNYARKIDHWAQSQGFETKLFVDRDQAGQKIRVRIRDIMDETERLLRGNPAQLLIYFSGHGFELSPGNEIWLLPEYDSWSTEAIDMAKNSHLAIETGADHIIFISDACRTMNKDHRARQVTGSAIIPSLQKKNYHVLLDTMHSTWPGEPSIEYKDETGQYRSIYSECLLDCLQGQVNEVIREIKNPASAPGFPAVICQDLDNYLKKTVPIITLEKTMESQHPGSRITSIEPIYISRFAPDPANEVEDPSPDTPVEETAIDDRYKTAKEIKLIRDKLKKVQDWKKEVTDEDKIQNSIDLIDSINQSLVNEMLPTDKTGLIIHGNENPDIFQLWNKSILWDERQESNGIRFISFDNTHPNLPLILISNPTSTGFYPVSLLPGFITSIIFDQDELLSIDYLPTRGFRREEAIFHRDRVAKRKAEIVTAAKNGIFQGSEELGTYIRRYKSLDPTLGLFAAYAYFQSGNFEDVIDVYRYMTNEIEPVLPEVRLLTYLATQQRNDYSLRPVNLVFPMLTQGWSYLSLVEHLNYKYLQGFLRPGLWTSFNRSGLEQLDNLFIKVK